ncbi:helix-turn-helix transcriptional regulator [Collinsella provencensis]|uniref:helix-turn-helix transcriptional regulator n=1 Tax=Collinsella provencensis TaxID=1937461 RepID=UPI00131C1B88|nr:LuxR family transcriptional regulator [Collinsella provencensis]
MTGFEKELANLGCALIQTRDLDGFAYALLNACPHIVHCDKTWLSFAGLAASGGGFPSYSNTLTDDEINAYYRDFAIDDYTAWYLRDPEVRAYRDSEVVSPAMQERSAIFEHWVKPMGMYWLGGFVLRIDRECVGDFLIMRAKEVGDFSDEELEKLELVANLAESWLCSNRLAITEASPVGNLTDREAEVSKLAAQGVGLRQIADELCISYATVRTHLANVYSKLGVHSRVELSRKIKDLL